MLIKSSCSSMAISSSKAAVRSWSRAAAFTRNFTPLAIIHHEQRQGGSTCERRLVAASNPAKRKIWRRILLRERAAFSASPQHETARRGHRRSCFLLRRLLVFCRRERPVHDRRFYFAQWRAHHGRRQDRHRIALPRFMERRHRRFRFSSARAGATSHRRAGARAIFQRSPPASKIKNRAGHHLRQCLDRHERDDSERRDRRRKLRGGCGLGRHKERSRERRGRGKSGHYRKTILKVIGFNIEYRTPNIEPRMSDCIGRWMFDVGCWAFSV